jgi:hypothetical protein
MNSTFVYQIITKYKTLSNISQGHCVKSEESVDGEQCCSLATSSTDAIFGIALTDATAGAWVEIQFGGVCFSAALGSAITAGCFLTANAEGKLVPAISGDRYIGLALPYSGTPSDGSLIEVIISQGVLP